MILFSARCGIREERASFDCLKVWGGLATRGTGHSTVGMIFRATFGLLSISPFGIARCWDAVAGRSLISRSWGHFAVVDYSGHSPDAAADAAIRHSPATD